MGFLNKLKFWKGEPEFPELPKDFSEPHQYDFSQQRDPGLGTDAFGLNSDPLKGYGKGFDNYPAPGYPSPSSFNDIQQHRGPFPQSNDNPIEKDIEILSAKIDALRATLDSMNQRLINIENIAKGEQQQRIRW